jgi:hypothetical protein
MVDVLAALAKDLVATLGAEEDGGSRDATSNAPGSMDRGRNKVPLLVTCLGRSFEIIMIKK